MPAIAVTDRNIYSDEFRAIFNQADFREWRNVYLLADGEAPVFYAHTRRFQVPMTEYSIRKICPEPAMFEQEFNSAWRGLRDMIGHKDKTLVIKKQLTANIDYPNSFQIYCVVGFLDSAVALPVRPVYPLNYINVTFNINLNDTKGHSAKTEQWLERWARRK